MAEKLGLRLVDPTFKTIAAKKKMDLLEFHRKAEKEHSIDKQFDAHLIADTKKGDCVVTTWLGPWMVKDADIRVWLYASRAARASRVAKRDGMAQQEAEKHIEERDESNRLRYLEIYRIDIHDHRDFDLVIHSEKYLPQESAEIIVATALAKGAKKRAPTKTAAAKKSKKKKR